jgi:hypothetical protein
LNDLSIYKSMINSTFDSVEKAIGIHVMLLVVEHALWNTRNKFEEANLITFSEDGIVLDTLEELEPQKAEAVAQCLILDIIATLGRLVGKQLAQQLLKELQETTTEGE